MWDRVIHLVRKGFFDSVLFGAAIGAPLLIILAAWLLFFGPLHVHAGDSPAVASVYAFSGVVVTACVSAVGLLLHRQADRRLEHDRHDDHARLRLDAAMRAGELLATDGSTLVPPAVAASGLLALTKLGQEVLAVTLLVDLWNKDNNLVSTEAAILVIDAALRSDSPDAQLVAAEVLCRNADRLDSSQSLHWPSAVEGTWNPAFGPRTKLLVVEALVIMSLNKRAADSTVRALAVRLYGVWEAEKHNKRVRGCIGKLLDAVMPAVRELEYKDFVQGSREVTLDQLEHAAQSKHTNPDGFLDRISDEFAENIASWSMNRIGLLIVTASGRLAVCESGIPSLYDGHPRRTTYRVGRRRGGLLRAGGF